MRKDITVQASARDSRGKNEARRTRAAGEIPAVLYGAGGGAVPIAVSPKEINRILHSKSGHNTIFDLAVGADKTPVMVVDWQHEPIKGSLLHVDLLRIDLSKRLRVMVPVHTTGDPVGVKIQGGLLEAITREVQIECLPDDIPEQFTMDVTKLELGHSIRAADIPMSGSMKLTSQGDMVLVHVVAIRTSDETAVAADAAPADAKAEPEVIKKGKKEEEAAADAKSKEKKK